MNNVIQSLQNKQLVWKANQAPTISSESLATGFEALDQALQGGWQQASTIAVKSRLGIGELRLFLPSLQACAQQQDRLLVLINPPYPINAELLYEQGFRLEDVLVINVKDSQSALWSAEQCLKSGGCHSVLMWQKRLQAHQTKRLQLAAKQGHATYILFDEHLLSQGLAFSLVFEVLANEQGISVKVNKRKGGWPLPPVHVDMQAKWPQLTQRSQAQNIVDFYPRRANQ